MLKEGQRVVHPRRYKLYGSVCRPVGWAFSAGRNKVYRYLVNWDDGLAEEWWDYQIRLLSPLEQLAEAAGDS